MNWPPLPIGIGVAKFEGLIRRPLSGFQKRQHFTEDLCRIPAVYFFNNHNIFRDRIFRS